MRIQIASDLHLESLRRRFVNYRALDVTDADVLVLAGDIAAGSDAVDIFADWPVPVIYVHGNHEAYGSVYGELTRAIRARAAGTQVRYLDRNELIMGDVRFLGCCLWTDYALYGTRERSMLMARRFMHDHTVIRAEEGEWFMPEHALAEHEKSFAWLQEQLVTPFDGRTVVVTHHGVAPASVHPRYRDDPVNAGFVSDLRHILDLADLWIHGHVHDSFDYAVGATRVIANPRGYAKNLNMAGAPVDLKWENPAFDPALVVEV
ncbi:metallophosphoesterase [Caballeronia sordidicola]|uniref:metallophosphoesterase n=1 Tax=Caballeronia sordidicola TaxID=196367 RepID=UPI0004D00CBD|nr:metallophosphoesterase [Caballeronia sordidicola]